VEGNALQDFGFEAQGFTLSRNPQWPGPALVSTNERYASELEALTKKLDEVDRMRQKAVESGDSRAQALKAEGDSKIQGATGEYEYLKAQLKESENAKAGAVAAMFAMAQETYPHASPDTFILPGADAQSNQDNDLLMSNAVQFLETSDAIMTDYHFGEDVVDPINTAIYHIARKQALGVAEEIDSVVTAYEAHAEAQGAHIKDLENSLLQLEALFLEHGLSLPVEYIDRARAAQE
jgi:hypothetical protein